MSELEKQRIFDQFQAEGIELLIPIILDESSDDDCVTTKHIEQVEEPQNLHQRYAQSLNAMMGVPIHNHSERELFKRKEWYESLVTNKIMKDDNLSKGIEYVDISTVNFEEFERKYVANGGRPAMITNVVEEKNWRAKDRWHSKEQLVSGYGNVPIKVTEIKPFHGMGRPHEVRIPIQLYAEYDDNNVADDPFYGFEHDMDQARKAFHEDYHVPSYFENDIYDLNERTREFYPNYKHFIVGGQRTGTNLHVDPKFTSAWNTLLCGYKKWAIFPPGSSDAYLELLGVKKYSQLPPSYWWLDVPQTIKEDIGMIECVQKPGETIYVPAGWWHCVLNLSFTVAITHNLLLQATLPFQWISFCDTYPCFTNYLKDNAKEIISRVIDNIDKDNSLSINQGISY